MRLRFGPKINCAVAEFAISLLLGMRAAVVAHDEARLCLFDRPRRREALRAGRSDVDSDWAVSLDFDGWREGLSSFSLRGPGQAQSPGRGFCLTRADHSA